MSETTTDPILTGTAAPVAKPDAATVCQTCGIPQVPCPRCNPAPKEVVKPAVNRQPGVVTTR